MERLLGWIADILAKIHDRILTINDGHSWGLDDKELHFVTIGLFGIGLFLVVQLVFRWLSKRSITAISWIYTFTVVLVVTFAIEAGQKVTGGDMETLDVYYGVWGFIVAFFIYLLIKGTLRAIKSLFTDNDGDDAPPKVRHYIGDRRGGPR